MKTYIQGLIQSLYVFQRNLQLSRQVQELTDEMSRQSDYCSSLGSACCTLLWRVSRCEESIQAILIGVS